jgi:O-glycosyl hydrolase
LVRVCRGCGLRFFGPASVVAAAATAGLAHPTFADPLRAIQLTASAGERQSLQAIGAGYTPVAYQGYRQLSDTRKAELAEMFWSGLDFNATRWFVRLGDYAPTLGARDLDAAYGTPYRDLIDAAVAQGVDTFAVSGDNAPDYMLRDQTFYDRRGSPFTKRVLRDDMVAEHAAVLADYALDVRETYGVSINALTLQNEPDIGEQPGAIYYTPEEMVAGVKALRAALDNRGLQSVRVIGPETANVDGTAFAMLDALRDDGEAWQALGGIAGHSYNMAATPTMYAHTEGGTRDYWQTEASTLGPEAPGDYQNAASIATRFLNDMNHGVTHWFHFLGDAENDPNDDGTRIIPYDPDAPGDDWATPLTKYHYFQQLTDAFDLGATFRATDSSLDGDMVWSYGRKPRVTFSTAVNPDGSVALALTNFTDESFPGDEPQTQSDFASYNAGYLAESFEVTIFVEDLADAGEVWFTLSVSDPMGERLNALQQSVRMTDGFLTFEIDPLQLVTLRSAPQLIPEPTGLAALAVGMGLITRRRKHLRVQAWSTKKPDRKTGRVHSRFSLEAGRVTTPRSSSR